MNISIKSVTRDCRSADCTRRTYKLQRKKTEHSSEKDKIHFNHSRQLSRQHNFDESKKDSYAQHIKFLIQSNSQYFQNKIKVTDKVRPNQYRFKIPTKTPSTMYKKDYWKKQKNYSIDNIKLNSNNLSITLNSLGNTNKIQAKTTYQKQFISNSSPQKNFQIPEKKTFLFTKQQLDSR